MRETKLAIILVTLSHLSIISGNPTSPTTDNQSENIISESEPDDSINPIVIGARRIIIGNGDLSLKNTEQNLRRGYKTKSDKETGNYPVKDIDEDFARNNWYLRENGGEVVVKFQNSLESQDLELGDVTKGNKWKYFENETEIVLVLRKSADQLDENEDQTRKFVQSFQTHDKFIDSLAAEGADKSDNGFWNDSNERVFKLGSSSEETFLKQAKRDPCDELGDIGSKNIHYDRFEAKKQKFKQIKKRINQIKSKNPKDIIELLPGEHDFGRNYVNVVQTMGGGKQSSLAWKNYNSDHDFLSLKHDQDIDGQGESDERRKEGYNIDLLNRKHSSLAWENDNSDHDFLHDRDIDGQGESDAKRKEGYNIDLLNRKHSSLAWENDNNDHDFLHDRDIDGQGESDAKRKEGYNIDLLNRKHSSLAWKNDNNDHDFLHDRDIDGQGESNARRKEDYDINLLNKNIIGGYSWVQACTCNLPRNALVAGNNSDGYDVVVARAVHNGDLIPGKCIPAQGTCFVSYNGKEYKKDTVEVLIPLVFKWLPAERGYIPLGAVEGGVTVNNEKMYIGRVTINDQTLTGKVLKSRRGINYPQNGKEKFARKYEALVLSPNY